VLTETVVANMLMKVFVFITVLTLLFSCNDKFNHLEFEKQVTYEILPQLIDSLHKNTRLNFPVPPLPDPNNRKTPELDSIRIQEVLKDLEKKERELLKDSVKLVTAVSDSTILLFNNDKHALIEHFNLKTNSLDTTFTNFQYKIELEKLKTDNDKIRFIYKSNLPEPIKIWRTDYDFHLNAVLTFSRIQFDKTRKFGVMNVFYTTGRLSGGSYKIFIRKNGDIWIIDQMVLTAIS
jgi:hypothetical protein